MRFSHVRLTCAVAITMAMAGTVASAQQTVYAIGSGGSTLISFPSNDPGSASVVASFSGAASFLDAIDFRPQTGELYGYLDSTDSFYRVNVATGVLTLDSQNPAGAATNTFQLGMDFNPSIDRLRVITDSAQNIVYNPITGTASAFTNLFYGPGDPNELKVANIIDNAYTNNFAGTPTTQQYAIDYDLDVLVTLANNAGTLGTVGSLGVDTDIYTGFDIFTDGGGTNLAYAILGGTGSGFYSIDLGTGKASLIGNLGLSDQVYSLAVVPAPGATGLLLASLIAVGRRRR
jgi:hypothetical protein